LIIIQIFFLLTTRVTCRCGAPVCPCPTAGGDRQASGTAVRWSDLLAVLFYF